MMGFGAPELIILMMGLVFVAVVVIVVVLLVRAFSGRPVATAPAVAGWFPDPGGHEYRHWDGAHWTDAVSDGGFESRAPL